MGFQHNIHPTMSYPYLYVKDLVGQVAFSIFLFSSCIFYAFNVLGYPDNYILANPMCTPPHIVPEWYFLPIHAMTYPIVTKLVLYQDLICLRQPMTTN